MSVLSSLSHRRRRAVLGAGTAILIIAGFSVYSATSGDDDVAPVNVSFVLGGGTAATGNGDQLAVRGYFRGLATAPDDTVYLFTEEKNGMTMWRREKSGTTKRIPVSGMNRATAQQAAVASDGSVYLAADDLWKVSPDGKAVKVIDAFCKPNQPTRTTTVSKFCAGQVTGVTVTKSGVVYIGDQVNRGQQSSYVHKIDGDEIELVAGRPPKGGESTKWSNPATRKAINPTSGTKARDVLVPDIWNSGWLASDEHGLYWRTGIGIVRINHDGTLSSFVGAKSPDDMRQPDGPFNSIGRALDASIARNATSSAPRGDLTVVPGRGEVYYSEAGENYTPPFARAFRWGGSKTVSQKKLEKDLVGGKIVYQVTDGKLSPVILGVQSIEASADALYAAVQSNDGDKNNPENWSTAVLQVRLPEGK
ncbi:hypothetical protein ACLVWQ_40035 [Streptomyces sp. CWNU-52B]|uniref:hypothetical protein n=1 Tax=unclassified Streptomyces TaxID=2593676 RepID=UPI0039BF543A